MTGDGPPPRRADGEAFLLVTRDLTKIFRAGGGPATAVRE
jgi:hypothetical protein